MYEVELTSTYPAAGKKKKKKVEFNKCHMHVAKASMHRKDQLPQACTFMLQKCTYCISYNRQNIS